MFFVINYSYIEIITQYPTLSTAYRPYSIKYNVNQGNSIKYFNNSIN